MRKPDGRVARTALTLSLPVGIAAATALVWQSSYAAFEAETYRSAGEWSSGQLYLTDNDQGSARFSLTGMTPGQTGTRCLRVTAHTNIPGTVKLYTTGARHSGTVLEDHLEVTVEQGVGGGFATCAGFVPESVIVAETPLEDLMTTIVGWGSGVGNWAVSGMPGEVKTYRFTWTFDSTGLTQNQVEALHEASTGVGFEWEEQSS